MYGYEGEGICSPASPAPMLYGLQSRAPSQLPWGKAGELPMSTTGALLQSVNNYLAHFSLFITRTPLGKNILMRKLFPFFLFTYFKGRN